MNRYESFERSIIFFQVIETSANAMDSDSHVLMVYPMMFFYIFTINKRVTEKNAKILYCN